MKILKRYFGSTKKRTDHVPDPCLFDYCDVYLPNCNFFITDIDLFIRDANGNFMFVEVKAKKRKPKKAQAISYRFLHELIIQATKTGALHLPNFMFLDWKYYGYHLLQYENTNLADGKAYFDNKEVSLDKLAEILSFRCDCLKLYASSQ